MNIGIVTIINVAFEVYTWLIFIRIILSWVRLNPYQPLVKFIYETTEPVLGLFRRIIPPIGVIDISPIAAFFALELVRRLLVNILLSVGIF
ncbi:YggT family protein [Desulfotomaculum arcticum]|uniref:YggT family protein n=1 Tax=Desulfotruncus arcticus DSM 17038 TaxID=1121424 RepID=A0A1I2STR9_9FIRM|nr:YggT family protein [Desulfotruncus arcticus]SFG56234.1 YggT family protein [Desulfotomaculum arcticum] [Desulfotruncus arcticus DSM 17038]